MVRGAFRPYQIFTRESQSVRVLPGEFCRCGFEPIADSHTVNRPIVRNSGVGAIVTTTAIGKEPTLSIFAHVPVTICGKRNREKWPRINCDGVPTSLTCSQKVVLMGGHLLWPRRSLGDSSTWDAWRSLTPRYVWKCLISDTLSRGGSVNGGLNPSSADQGVSRDLDHLPFRTITGMVEMKLPKWASPPWNQ